LGHGLIHRVDRLNAFIACTDAGRHAHPVQFLICRRCGAVDELDDQAIVVAIQHAAADKRFHPVLTTLDVEGTFSKCSLRFL
jgi:Fur family transcriptional regulator, zinc uptake regulator